MSHSDLAQRRVVLQKQQQLCVEPPPSALNVTLPAFAAESRRPHPRARIYRSISVADAGDQQQTRRPPLLLSIDGTDRWTDGQTPDRYIDPAPHVLRAASTKTPFVDGLAGPKKPVLDAGAHWRHLANTIERYEHGTDTRPCKCQTNLTTCMLPRPHEKLISQDHIVSAFTRCLRRCRLAPRRQISHTERQWAENCNKLNTQIYFFKLQSALCQFQTIIVSECCLIKLLPYILLKIFIHREIR